MAANRGGFGLRRANLGVARNVAQAAVTVLQGNQGAAQARVVLGLPRGAPLTPPILVVLAQNAGINVPGPYFQRSQAFWWARNMPSWPPGGPPLPPHGGGQPLPPNLQGLAPQPRGRRARPPPQPPQPAGGPPQGHWAPPIPNNQRHANRNKLRVFGSINNPNDFQGINDGDRFFGYLDVAGRGYEIRLTKATSQAGKHYLRGIVLVPGAP